MTPPKTPPRDSRRMPSGSVFYERIVPLLLLVFAIVLVIVLLAAVAGVLGILHF
jgi:hypothetical protein